MDFLRFLACARDPLRRFAWSRFKNCGLFTISAEIRVVKVQKLRTFYEFLRCARDPLRRFAWSRFKNWGLFTISSMRARPSAEIRVVEVQKLRTFYDFCGARATLCGDLRGRGSKTGDFLRFLACARDPLRRSCASKRSRCGPLRRLCVSKRSCCGAVQYSCSRNGLWKLSRGLRACFRDPAVAGSIPPWSAAAPA